jgi:hypothetical protein
MKKEIKKVEIFSKGFCIEKNISCDEPFDSEKWFRKNIVQEMTRSELENRVCEYHDIIYQLRNEITKLKENGR